MAPIQAIGPSATSSLSASSPVISIPPMTTATTTDRPVTVRL
jgi:hypothetical protein